MDVIISAVYALWTLRRAARRLLGALGICALAPLVQAQAQLLTREVQYEYDGTTGLVTLERVDPTQPHCAETAYEYDVYGNKNKVTVRPCVAGTNNVATSAAATFAARVTDNSFDAKTTGATAKDNHPAGAYLTKSIARRTDGTVGKQSEAVYDPRFGAATVQTDVASQDATKSLTKRAEYDELGRLKTEYVPVNPGGGPTNESRVEYQWFYCGGTQPVVSTAATAGPACLNQALGSAVTLYRSNMLVDAAGKVLTDVPLQITSAYYVEATPKDSAGIVIGAMSRTHYDSLHREIVKETQSYSGQWTLTIVAYDALGMKAASWSSYFGRSDPAGITFTAPQIELRQWTYELDLLHRPIEQRQYWRGVVNGPTTIVSSQATYNGLVASSTIPDTSSPDGVARTTTVRKNAIGKAVQTIDVYGATLSSAYDAVGNLVQTVDALGNTTTITYTATTARFKEGMSDPNQGAWSYSYDALGQLKTQTDAKAQTTTLAYDELGRLTQKTNPTQNGFWYYDKTEAGAWCAAGLNRLCESKAGNTAGTITRDAVSYDALSRPSQTTTTRDRAYTSAVTYDSLGRMATQRYPSGFTVQYGYSVGGNGKVAGVLEKVFDNAAGGKVFWRIDTITPASVFDARGNLMRSDLGNGLGTNHAFDNISGKAFNLLTGSPTAPAGPPFSSALYHQYAYDKANNVFTREDKVGAYSETYSYDRLNRLTSYTMLSGDAAANRTVTLDYNAIGNILRKGDLGGYSYAGGRPHAVSASGGTSYAYDANGSLTSAVGNQSRSVAWTGFNQPASMSYQGNKSVAFTYGQGFERIREVITDGATVRTLDKLHPDNQGGLAYEREETKVGAAAPSVENRHYISVGGAVIAVVKTVNDSGVVEADPNKTHYWHKDALGSIVAVSNASGAVLERMAFDPWGKRVRDSGLADPTLNPAHGDRGFTGHEHIDEMQLVHMNGRVYDPLLGKFLSIDPVVGDPGNLQTYNRYSYVYNQPTRYADATGECPWCVVFILGAMLSLEGNKHWKMVGSIMMFAALGPGGGLVEGGLGAAGAFSSQAITVAMPVISSSIAGGITGFIASGGSVEAAFTEAVFAGVTTGIGVSPVGNAGAVVAHAMVGCVRGAVSGGGCGPSAMAGAFGKLTTIGTQGMGVGPAQFIASAIAGGTASVIGGGKFANGAYQAAFGYVLTVSASRQSGPVGRALTADEVAEARTVFGEKIDYDRVRVIGEKFLFFQDAARPMAPNGNIYWPGDCGDLASCQGGRNVGTFIHEMTHVMQQQNGVNVLLRGFFLQAGNILSLGLYDPYSYTYDASKSFKSHNIEQQGDIARDIYFGRHPNNIE
jgi:RHS repeat-associated protein